MYCVPFSVNYCILLRFEITALFFQMFVIQIKYNFHEWFSHCLHLTTILKISIISMFHYIISHINFKIWIAFVLLQIIILVYILSRRANIL